MDIENEEDAKMATVGVFAADEPINEPDEDNKITGEVQSSNDAEHLDVAVDELEESFRVLARLHMSYCWLCSAQEQAQK
jgi:hypothetical protein